MVYGKFWRFSEGIPDYIDQSPGKYGVIGNHFPGIGEQGDQEPVNCGPKISSNSISPNSYNMKLVYHDWDRAVKRSNRLF
jgi:hypothetical protein